MEQETLCWSCANAYADKCEWIRRCVPLKGWCAKPTKVRMHLSSGEVMARSYHVYECPNYRRDPVRAGVVSQICPVCRRRFYQFTQASPYCSSRCRELGRLKIL